MILEESFLMENTSLAQMVVDIAVAIMDLLKDFGKKKDVQFIVVFVNMEIKYWKEIKLLNAAMAAVIVRA